MLEIEIDGKKLEAEENTMVIQVADQHGIYIPRFCYHKHLTVAANCRMCLVEVEKSPKPLPACATPVMPGMKVFTRSPKAIAAQKAVMEFLLINHPLDCPICDQGGECELQDLSMGYGAAVSYFHEGKRSVKDKDIGPLVSTDLTRCIHCTRCVRFGEEIAGFRELGATFRGEDMEIGTYVTHSLRSEVSGNIIDLCPVGALTSKPFRFTARAWELQQFPTIAAHDCVGSHLYAHTRNGTVMRVVARENPTLNQTWISDRDRFSYQGLNHPDRLKKPMIRKNNEWKETDWQTALEFAATSLQTILKEHGPEQIAALASPNSTLEEFYLLQKLWRALGSSNIDHRLRQSDFSDENPFPKMNITLEELEKCDVILLIGSNIQKEQPMLSLRVRKAALKGAKILAINMVDYAFHFKTHLKSIVAPQKMVETLGNIANALSSSKNESNTFAEKFSSVLAGAKKVAVMLGAQALNHHQASHIRAFAQQISEKTQGSLIFLTEGCNAQGAVIAGAVPHRGAYGSEVVKGSDVLKIWRDKCKAFLLLNVEPDLDCATPEMALHALAQAQCVIAVSAFRSPVLEQYAHVMLPVTPFTETSGTFVNVLGEWQSFQGVTHPLGEARPAWKVLRVLGNLLDRIGFDFESSEAVRDELKSLQKETQTVSKKQDWQTSNDEIELMRIGEIPIYAGDAILRRATALQATQNIMEGNVAVAKINRSLAEKKHLKEGHFVLVKQNQNVVRLPLVIDDKIPDGAVWIAGGIPATAGLSELFGAVEIILQG